ncbi:hypothetical protein H310_14564 [Aphanomyces invadans]|uniref:DUF659 domain-containing protein n=1 Tax=Aphanomyces invadans TaxID=157072 RepID=A0A024T940_9STRA|nr:hypothetical protein H310_14564 [Aphanomyces invadans]ETV90670.1 hypothetical protein H310_14564 [Aphanomyces invadans]|eukprot:XP_008880667.1 hypothetical protein H310_14564 [Aphanomyces invadans]
MAGTSAQSSPATPVRVPALVEFWLWPKIIFHFCYAHQINLLVKGTIASTWQITVAQAHDVVSMLNQSTAKWLPRQRDSMKTVYG